MLSDKVEKFLKDAAPFSIKEIIADYEREVFKKEHPALYSILDLLIIYFLINDIGYMNYYRLNVNFVDCCDKKRDQLIKKAKQQFGDSIELAFWENYTMYILYGAPPFEEVNIEFANQSETLVPFFYFYNENSNQYKKEAIALYKQINKHLSFKDNYIYSILTPKIRHLINIE